MKRVNKKNIIYHHDNILLMNSVIPGVMYKRLTTNLNTYNYALIQYILIPKGKNNTRQKDIL